MCEAERTRLVVLGGAGVGKSSILKRFLFSSYTDKYKSTVEDLYSREFDLGPISVKVDILDTCGELEFPAMRRLSMATAHAFLLVYSICSEASLASLKGFLEEIREQRPDYQELPIVVAGNKVDLPRQVQLEDVSEFIYCSLPRLRVKLIECSAKEDFNIREIFKCFVTLAKILPPLGEETPLKRRSSAYVKGGQRRGGSPASGCLGGATSSDKDSKDTDSKDGETPTSSRLKPRSRSLIRRCSRKAKQQIRDSAHPTSGEDCNIS